MHSKLELLEPRVDISADEAVLRVATIFRALGVDEATSVHVAKHLADASLCGVESHGVMRILQYADQFRSGYMRVGAKPEYRASESGTHEVDGDGGIGIPAMSLAYEHGMELAVNSGISAIAIRNVGHTGRHGAFADTAANRGFLTVLVGGGNRRTWRQVAPYGGARALLPTNPWCVGIPGGKFGPVILDFATSKIAGGWIYAAHSAGALLPEGAVIDRDGNLTRDPEDYFNGGAILPSGGHKGFALALVAELIAEAMLGPVSTEANWLLICIDTSRFQSPSRLTEFAEEILAELRSCPPAPGFDKVEIPGERERNHRIMAKGVISIPESTWQQLLELQASLAKTGNSNRGASK